MPVERELERGRRGAAGEPRAPSRAAQGWGEPAFLARVSRMLAGHRGPPQPEEVRLSALSPPPSCRGRTPSPGLGRWRWAGVWPVTAVARSALSWGLLSAPGSQGVSGGETGRGERPARGQGQYHLQPLGSGPSVERVLLWFS